MSLLAELKRRNVFRVGIFYAVLSWLILQVADVAFGVTQLPDWSLTLVAIILALGFIPTLIFAWVFELTPEGIKLEKDVDRSQSVTHETARKLDVALLVMLVVVAGLFLVDLLGPDRTHPAQSVAAEDVVDVTDINSIAVLPFEDFSAEGDQRHLGVGLADSILHMLAQIPDLRVAARTSSFSYQGKDVNVATIGQELNVGAVLEGSVQRSGDTLRIIAQLIRVADQSHLWSDTFDRPTGDIFAIQDEISQEVAQVLRPAASAETTLTAERTSVEAYEHFVRGNDLWRERTRTSIDQAIEEFKAAIALDPGYAPAHAGLAMAHIFSTFYGARSPQEIRLVAEQAIDRALELDPDNALAHAARGQLHVMFEDPMEAGEAFRRSVALNPSDATVHVWLSYFTTDPEEADRSMEKAYALDPLNLYVVASYAVRLAVRGQYERGVEIARRGVAINPEAPLAYAGLSRTHSAAGHIDDMIRARLAEIERSPKAPAPYFSIAQAFNDLGDHERAWEWFEKARTLNPTLLPQFEMYLNEARFSQLVPAMRSRVDRRPDSAREKVQLCLALSTTDQHAEALETCGALTDAYLEQRRTGVLTDIHQAFLALAWLSLEAGDHALAERSLAQVDEYRLFWSLGQVNAWFDPMLSAQIAALMGDRDAVNNNLERAVANGFTEAHLLEYIPWWEPYRNDPAFQAILERIRQRQASMLNGLEAEGL